MMYILFYLSYGFVVLVIEELVYHIDIKINFDWYLIFPNLFITYKKILDSFVFFGT